MTYVAWSVVYGEQPSAAKWNQLGTNDAHFYSFLGDNLAWQSWSPTLTGITVGNGTTTAKYTQIGKTVFFNLQFLFGTTSSATSTFAPTLPVTASANEYISSSYNKPIGSAIALDSGANRYLGTPYLASTTTFNIYMWKADTTILYSANSWSNGQPIAWGTADSFSIQGMYEAA